MINYNPIYKSYMKKIAIMSDTHGFIDAQMMNLFKKCDEIWHAGDFGWNNEIKKFIETYETKGVYGNIDGQEIRKIYPKINKFQCEKINILMTHIGGYPKKYKSEIKNEILNYKPDLYICGHSHILKIMYDKNHNLIHINPGAAGKEGFHQKRTIVLIDIKERNISNIRVVELGNRAKLTKPIN